MDESAIYKRLAEAWHAAACETTNSTLKACYADRAAGYLAMALNERRRREAASRETR